MATKTLLASGPIETGVVYGLAGSTATFFTANDTLALGAFTGYVSTIVTIGAITSTAGTGSLVMTPGSQVTTTNCSTIIKHSPGFLATTTSGSPSTGPSSGGSTPGVFIDLGN